VDAVAHSPSWPPEPIVGYAEFMDAYMEALTSGRITGRAPGPPPRSGSPVDEDFEARRRLVEASRQTLKETGCKPLPPYVKLTSVEVQQKSGVTLNGDMYGLPVPPTLERLEKRGAPWLTQAFRKSGVIGKDNAVKEIVNFKRLPLTGADSAGGAGPKAFLTVRWGKDSPDLHKELFVKMPWACDGSPREMGGDAFYRWKCSCTADYEAQETRIYRFLGPLFPFRIPKYYFADICRENTNYVLITEKIPFGKPGQKEWKPYEVMPVAQKFFDFNLEPRMQSEMYYCLMRSQARLAAWDKMGLFDAVDPQVRGLEMAHPVSGYFALPQDLGEKKWAARTRQGEMCAAKWMEFVGEVGKNMYPPEHTDPAFLEAICACVKDATCYKEELFAYTCIFPDMIAMQHANLQSDNGFFWLNAKGQMDCGLIDWGGAAPKQFAMVLGGCLTSAEGDVLDEHEEGLLRCFVEEYHRECGIVLSIDEFRRQWLLSYCSYLASIGTNVEMETFRELPKEQWKGITSLWDEKVVGIWNVRCQAFMIRNALKYLHLRWTRGGRGRLHCHETFFEWRDYWQARAQEASRPGRAWEEVLAEIAERQGAAGQAAGAAAGPGS